MSSRSQGQQHQQQQHHRRPFNPFARGTSRSNRTTALTYRDNRYSTNTRRRGRWNNVAITGLCLCFSYWFLAVIRQPQTPKPSSHHHSQLEETNPFAAVSRREHTATQQPVASPVVPVVPHYHSPLRKQPPPPTHIPSRQSPPPTHIPTRIPTRAPQTAVDDRHFPPTLPPDNNNEEEEAGEEQPESGNTTTATSTTTSSGTNSTTAMTNGSSTTNETNGVTVFSVDDNNHTISTTTAETILRNDTNTDQNEPLPIAGNGTQEIKNKTTTFLRIDVTEVVPEKTNSTTDQATESQLETEESNHTETVWHDWNDTTTNNSGNETERVADARKLDDFDRFDNNIGSKTNRTNKTHVLFEGTTDTTTSNWTRSFPKTKKTGTTSKVVSKDNSTGTDLAVDGSTNYTASTDEEEESKPVEDVSLFGKTNDSAKSKNSNETETNPSNADGSTRMEEMLVHTTSRTLEVDNHTDTNNDAGSDAAANQTASIENEFQLSQDTKATADTTTFLVELNKNGKSSNHTLLQNATHDTTIHEERDATPPLEAHSSEQ